MRLLRWMQNRFRYEVAPLGQRRRTKTVSRVNSLRPYRQIENVDFMYGYRMMTREAKQTYMNDVLFGQFYVLTQRKLRSLSFYSASQILYP